MGSKSVVVQKPAKEEAKEKLVKQTDEETYLQKR
jgi:hypothetical protein